MKKRSLKGSRELPITWTAQTITIQVDTLPPFDLQGLVGSNFTFPVVLQLGRTKLAGNAKVLKADATRVLKMNLKPLNEELADFNPAEIQELEEARLSIKAETGIDPVTTSPISGDDSLFVEPVPEEQVVEGEEENHD